MELLITTPVENQKIRELYDKTQQEIKEDVEMINTWRAKQPHLPANLTDDFIERILLRNKFRVERTKEKLDNYFTLRGKNQDLISGFETIVPSKHFIMCLPMPKLTPNFERVMIFKLLNTDPNIYDVTEFVRLNLAFLELDLQYDDSVGVRFIYDFEGLSFRHVLKWNPLLLNKFMSLIEKAYSWRIAGVEMMNLPEFAGKILEICKMVFQPKIYERIRSHSSIEGVYDIIPKECLPKEYGGTCSNVVDLLGKWDEAFKNHHDFFIENCNRVSDESLRSVDVTRGQDFGPDGTFKKLSVD